MALRSSNCERYDFLNNMARNYGKKKTSNRETKRNKQALKDKRADKIIWNQPPNNNKQPKRSLTMQKNMHSRNGPLKDLQA